jgi:hypothetical protein
MCAGHRLGTQSAGNLAFNPCNCQTGSVWPHDNSLIAIGFKFYEFHDAETATPGISFICPFHAKVRKNKKAASHLLSYCGGMLDTNSAVMNTAADQNLRAFPC